MTTPEQIIDLFAVPAGTVALVHPSIGDHRPGLPGGDRRLPRQVGRPARHDEDHRRPETEADVRKALGDDQLSVKLLHHPEASAWPASASAWSGTAWSSSIA